MARAAIGGDPAAMHAAALIDLRWGDRTALVVDRAVSQLEAVARLSGSNAPLLADLSAAHLVRFEVTRDARSLFKAVETAEHALAVDPACMTARYDLVLALHHFGLAAQAARESRAYLARDSASRWARAVRAIGRQSAAPPPGAAPGADADSASIDAFVARDHQAARLLGWDMALARWSELAARGDAEGAERGLRFAEMLGRALRARGGDQTLDDAVRAVRRRAGDPVAYQAAVAAHLRYAAGQRRYRAAEYERAAAEFANALAVRGVPSSLDQWSRVFRASSLVHSGRADEGERLVRAVLAAADTLRHPALVGRAHASLGTSLGRRGQEAAAERTLAAGERFYARSGEPEGAAGMQSMLMELAFLRGDGARGYAMARHTLAALRQHRHSVWRHNVLYTLAAEGGADGFGRAAARVQEESVDAAAGTGRALDLAEALLARARLRVVAGRRGGLGADVRAAQALLATVPRGSGRAYTEADRQLSQGLSLLAARPGAAIPLIDSSVAFFDRLGSVARLVPALSIRAEAHAAAGNTGAALADLTRAVGLLDARASRMGSTPERAMFYRTARRVLDRIVMLRVAGGESRAALTDLERTRRIISWGDRPSQGEPALPLVRGETGIVYARVADTLLVWTVADTVVRFARTTVDSAWLGSAIERARAVLELRSSEARSRPVLAELYELLVRPVADRLGAPGRSLVVVADGELAAVPFAALFDAARGRYLVEDYELRFTTTLREARAAPARGRTPGRVLIVGDPAFDSALHPGLGRLVGAAAEAAALTDVYARYILLAGADARRAAVAGALADAAIVHYAGHAVSDAERPERSYLVLAADGDSSQLSATAIARLPLGAVRLVVLSACQTVGAPREAVSGLAGLAGAFRAAGARGVIGSAWRVDDVLTRPLMAEFHRRYSTSGDGPGALRAAQLALLGSGSPTLRAPAAWAAFRYMGS